MLVTMVLFCSSWRLHRTTLGHKDKEKEKKKKEREKEEGEGRRRKQTQEGAGGRRQVLLGGVQVSWERKEPVKQKGRKGVWEKGGEGQEGK